MLKHFTPIWKLKWIYSVGCIFFNAILFNVRVKHKIHTCLKQQSTGCVNGRIFIFGWTIHLSLTFYRNTWKKFKHTPLIHNIQLYIQKLFTNPNPKICKSAEKKKTKAVHVITIQKCSWRLKYCIHTYMNTIANICTTYVPCIIIYNKK